MKKITKKLSLTVVVAGMITPLALMTSNSNVKVEQEVTKNNSDETVKINDIDSGVESNDEISNPNNPSDNIKVSVGEMIDSDNCTAENTGTTATTWMGITRGDVEFSITKDYTSASDLGEVSISKRPTAILTSNNLTIPSYIINNGKKYNVTSIGKEALGGFNGLTGTLSIPASVVSIGDNAFFFDQNLTKLDLSNATGLETIGDLAFNGCSGLTSLDLSGATSLQTIGAGAFQLCSGLTGTLTIPASVTSIGQNAFSNCSGLTGTLTIPASVTSIGGGAFTSNAFTDFKFLSETPPATLGTDIFGTNVTKTLWVPSAQAKTNYDPFAKTNFGLEDSTYIKFIEIVPTSVDITNLNGPYTINLNETNKVIATAMADVQPVEATNKNVDWSLVDAPSWLKIDANGEISANDNLKNATPDQFTFKIKVNCQGDRNISKTTSDIQLNVTYAPITSITIDNIASQTIELGENNPVLVTCSATVNPNPGAQQEITWSIENKPSWIDINQNSGVISINNATDVALVNNQQTITVKATSVQDSAISATKQFTINFTQPQPVDIEIDGLGDYVIPVNANFNKTLSVKQVSPEYASKEVNWSLKNAPAGMAIGSATGIITYTPTTVANKIDFKVVVTSIVPSATFTKEFDASITVTEGTVDSVTIISPQASEFDVQLNETAKILIEKCEANVAATGILTKTVGWKLENQPTWVTIDPNAGKLTVNPITDASQIGIHKFFIVAESDADSTKKDKVEITINVTQASSTDSLFWLWILVAETGTLLLGSVISVIAITIRKQKNKL